MQFFTGRDERNAEANRPISSLWNWQHTTFGTWGSQVQILPLRPRLSRSSPLAGHSFGHSFAVFRERFAGSGQVIRMMVSIPLQQHFQRHAEISSSLPGAGSSLHQPSRRRVSQDVRRHIGPETSIRRNVSERLFDRLHRFPVPLHREALPSPFPPTQVRQQLSWNGNRRLSLVCFPPPCRAPIKYAAININPPSTNCRLQCGSANRA